MHDLVFTSEGDPSAILVETLERESRMAILSPTNIEGGYPGATPQAGGDWRAVATCDYLGFMLRASALEECGFLDPVYQYCWGAIHELAHRLNTCGWFVAYSDRVSYRHLGGSTYGAQGTKTISREEYQRNAKRFAFDHLREKYGADWDETFWAAAQPFGARENTFGMHKQYWSRAFSAAELEQRAGTGRPSRLSPDERAGLVKLHLGCGPDKRAGWINVDTQAEVQPDIVSSVESLPMVFDASVDVIEACHLFEHLTFDQARRALREWARILRPGGELFLELPDLERCIRILGKYKDNGGFDLGLIGIHGYPPAIEKQGVPQIHKWSWTKSALRAELREAGFADVEFGPITQTWRPAAKVGRDMRLRALRGTATREHDAGLRARIQALDPWFYPLRVGPIDVQAGVGSPVSHEFLVNHTHCRATLLVDEVAARCELRGKSVLELASNCGYWSARYAELGATRVVGLEGREEYLQQAQLYWSEGRFLPAEDFTFLRGNVSEREGWRQLRVLGPYDVTLVAGILYHVPNYREVLRWAAEITREALVIDTRVVHDEEVIKEEPGELRFNAIEATRRKVVPNLKLLVLALEELGFAPEILPAGFSEAVGVENVDSFVKYNRVAIFARRVRVPSARELQSAGSIGS
jgi:2-polyprenyl-3-methyl-5-hydroxy-6-metoxy-1,4-benzoquinol methylase